jgi:hypothetical protein
MQTGDRLPNWRSRRTVALSDELAELGTEASRRCAVDDVVIDGYGQIEQAPRFDLAVDDSRACAHATDNDPERHQG